MNLKNYIKWTKSIDVYEVSPKVASTSTWGFKELKNLTVPTFDLSDPEQGDEGYSSIRNDKISEWARLQWPQLNFVEAKIQIQKPGEACQPHLDLLGEYIERICETMPGLLKLTHSLTKPAIDVWRMFVAIDNHVAGQIFNVNDTTWTWASGDCIRLNNWQALHWTENQSAVDRAIIKITGVRF